MLKKDWGKLFQREVKNLGLNKSNIVGTCDVFNDCQKIIIISNTCIPSGIAKG
jgi:hypothetical protein